MRSIRRGAVALAVAGLLGASLSGVAVAPPGVAAALCNGLPCYTVTVILTGTGSGTFESTNSSYVADGGITCTLLNGVVVDSANCSLKYTDFGLGITVYWKLTPATGTSGCIAHCSTAVQTGGAYVTADTVLAADLNLISEGLEVKRDGSGSISVNGVPCSFPCTPSFNYGTHVDLAATPDAGNVFLGWVGACAGQDSTCTLVMTSQLSTTGRFGPATYSMQVSTSGSGTVVSTPSGISCAQAGGTCAHAFANGQVVSLKATGSTGWVFGSWGGACATKGNPCSVTMSADRALSATFVAGPPTAVPTHTPTPGGPKVTQRPSTAPGVTVAPGGPTEPLPATEAPAASSDQGAVATPPASLSPGASTSPVLTDAPVSGDSTLFILLIVIGIVLIGAIVFLGIQVGRLRPRT
jgi:Divergent InlB B-repeat domain